MDPPGGSILEVQAVHRLLVVPGDLASDDFHPPESSRSETQFLRGGVGGRWRGAGVGSPKTEERELQMVGDEVNLRAGDQARNAEASARSPADH